MTEPSISSAVSVDVGARIGALFDSASVQRVDVAGALTVAQGRCDAQPVCLVVTDRSVAGGSLGVSESDLLGSTFARCRVETMPVALLLDSAGARLTSGLAGLGAFRRMLKSR